MITNDRRLSLALRMTLAAALLVLATLAPVWAADDPKLECESFLDMRDRSGEFTKINLSGQLLKILGSGLKDMPDEAGVIADMATRIGSLHMVSFEMGSRMRVATQAKIDALQKRLAGRGWDVIVEVQDEEDLTLVLTRSKGDTILGISVLVVDDEDFFCANITGELHADDLKKLVDQFGGEGAAMFD